MYILLAVFFAVLGVAGLYFSVDAGVMAGLGLLPWQFIGMQSKFAPVVLILSALAGVTYFIYIRDWLLVVLFILVQSYNYYGYKKKIKST
ncbi:MAG: hypothetical protein ACOCQN_04695 [Halanaerobiaceae bacterium]